MTAPITFYLLDNKNQFENHFDSLLELMEMSAGDDGILGFEKALDFQGSQNFKHDLCDQVAAGICKIIIAKDKQNNVVLSCLLKGSHQDTSKHIYDLQKGFIHPELRGSGLLPKAMCFIARVAMKNNVDVLTLDVRGNTKAHRLWQRVGFKTFGIMNDYARYNGKKYSGHYMSITTKELQERFHDYGNSIEMTGA